MTKRLTAITYIRGFAALLIFFCHVAFISDAFELSTWLNTGVPIFFIISAYLLSLKPNVSRNTYSFYKRRLSSIFPSYWIYLIAVISVLSILGQAPDIKSIICYSLGLSGFITDTGLLGLGHLWFISVLLICYFLIPLLHYICANYTTGGGKVLICIIILFQMILFSICGYPSYGIHVGSYIFVYCLFKQTRGNIAKVQFIYAAIILSAVRLIFDPVFIKMDYSIYYYYDALFQPLARFCLAMALFTTFISGSEYIERWAKSHYKADAVITRFSKISYEIYLTHQFILLAFWKFFPSLHNGAGFIVWIIISFATTILNSMIVVYVKDLVQNKLIKFNKLTW